MWLRRSCLLVAVASIGCGKAGDGDQPRDECAPIRADATKALADLGKRLPPLEVAKTIERCVAPTGDECERVAAIVRAIPSFVPTLGPTPDNALATCRGAPPELRRCLLPSYVLERRDECAALLDKLRDATISSIEVTPRGPGSGPGAGTGCKPIDVALEVSPAGVKVKPSYSAAWNGPIADDKLEAELATSVDECPGEAEITATDDATYQQIIRAMDSATKVGLQTGFGPDTGHDRARAAPPAPGDKTALQSAPVLIITKTEVTFEGKLVTTRDSDTLASALETALRARQKAQPGSLLILQADKDTPGRVMNVVVSTANAAGYDGLMFAVKNR